MQPKFILVIISVLATTFVFGFQHDSKPLQKTYDKRSNELIKDLKQQRGEELKYNGLSVLNENLEVEFYYEITKILTDNVRNNFFVQDSGLEAYLESIAKSLLDTNDNLRSTKKILIYRDPLVNAQCHGEGTITVNLGLLYKSESEGQLAFVIAHEIAHYQLNHVFESISDYIESKKGRLQRKVDKIQKGTLSLKDLEFIQGWFNTRGQFNRKAELEADSLASSMMLNSGYNYEDIIAGLDLLEDAFNPKYPLRTKLFDPFIFESYPFKKRWLQPQLSIYSRRNTFPLFKYDSIKDHPDTKIRREQILRNFTGRKEKSDNQHYQPRPLLATVSEFEAVRASYKQSYFDIGLHIAIQLKKRYPQNKQLNFYIGRFMHELAIAKIDNNPDQYLQRYTKPFSDETIALNSFLHNLTWRESAELSYHFMKNPDNFDITSPDHFKLLAKLCHLTSRFDEEKMVKKVFKNQFPKTNFATYSDENEIVQH